MFMATLTNDSIVSSGPNNFSLNLSGYRAMDLWSLGVGGVMTASATSCVFNRGGMLFV